AAHRDRRAIGHAWPPAWSEGGGMPGIGARALATAIGDEAEAGDDAGVVVALARRRRERIAVPVDGADERGIAMRLAAGGGLVFKRRSLAAGDSARRRHLRPCLVG